MGIGNIIITILITYYSIYFIDLFNRNKRYAIQQGNRALDTLRKIPLKTLEEQKAFLNTKYPKRPKWKFSWSMVLPMAWKMAVFIALYQGWAYLIGLFNYETQIWQAMIFVLTFPLLVNFILAKFNVQKSDMLAFFKKY